MQNKRIKHFVETEDIGIVTVTQFFTYEVICGGYLYTLYSDDFRESLLEII